MATIDQVYALLVAQDARNDPQLWLAGDDSGTVSGEGFFVPSNPAECAGVLCYLAVIPPNYGYMGGDSDAVYFRVGWVKPYIRSDASIPWLEIGGYNQMVSGPGNRLESLYYFLPPGVEAIFTAYYPPT